MQLFYFQIMINIVFIQIFSQYEWWNLLKNKKNKGFLIVLKANHEYTLIAFLYWDNNEIILYVKKCLDDEIWTSNK